jgi:penicillin-binding protein 2
MPIDWQQFHARDDRTPAVVDPRRRLWICLAGFLALLLVVFGRTVQLELAYGEGYRDEALRPVEKETPLPANRGRILARDGTPLAFDRWIQAVAMDYRWLQEPADTIWLRRMARARLAKTDRRNAEKLAAAQAAVLADRTTLVERLVKLCGIPSSEWTARTQRIQARVERIAAEANRRKQSTSSDEHETDGSWAVRIRRLLLETPPPPRIVVAEELAHHVVADDVSPAVLTEIRDHADRYPGVKIVAVARRTYPSGVLAAHVLGHLGPVEKQELRTSDLQPDDLVGRMGIERQCEAELRGHRGVAIDQTDHSGRIITSYRSIEPVAGRDVTLTIDANLQRTAEDLLHAASQRGQDSFSPRLPRKSSSDPFLLGGAIVVMDLRDGALLAAASMPTFDPNAFVRGRTEEITALLADKSHPLFNRVCSMAIPPGSTFKTLTSVALLESSAIGPEEPFHCQGYLHQPDRQRCEIYVRQGVGHGDVTLADALAVSCNVYFFQFAGQMGPRPLVDWAERFGFGRPTGVDLPGEVAGSLPSPEMVRQRGRGSWRKSDTQSMAVGQGSLTATPLQVLRMIAAVACDGRIITPHVEDGGHRTMAAPFRIALAARTLQTVREGLRRVVADPNGTAHATVFLESIAIAGKTGTAETGEEQASHAWFAGYVPADKPKLAFVVVLEHAGDGSIAAGPLAKRLVLRMQQLGML